MSFLDTINEDLKSALKNRNQAGLRALRAAKSEILLALTEKGGPKELDQASAMRIVQKMVKQRTESMGIYREQNRKDLAVLEEEEIIVLEKYLPKQMNEGEMTQTVIEIIKNTKAAGMKDMGKVMGIANKQTAGKADGKALAGIVRRLLTNGPQNDT